jgi:hypothetical protein
MVSLHLYVYGTVFIVDPEFTYISTGWLVCWRSHFFPRPKPSKSTSKSRTGINILPTTVGRHAGPDLATNCIHRSTGFRLPSSTALFGGPPNIFCYSSQRLLANRSRMQLVCSASGHSGPTVDSILYAGFPTVQPPIEASAIPTILFRGCQEDASVSGRSAHLDALLAFPIFLGPR